ncbi:hypothetical protein QUA56_24335 [Microcoleus sp. N3A4]|uniref:hypothetical protein n=1 Tax=Microcoleus sp. N3A4 TaxID=3055379 RepID=UPI002FD41239
MAVSVPIGPRTSCDRPAAKPLTNSLGYSQHDRSFVLMNEVAIDLFLSTADFSQAFWLVPQSTRMGEGRSLFSPIAQPPLIRSDN